jgi:hypothetical protein
MNALVNAIHGILENGEMYFYKQREFLGYEITYLFVQLLAFQEK